MLVQKFTIWQPPDDKPTVFVYRKHLMVAKVYRPTPASVRRINRFLRGAPITRAWFTRGGLSVDYVPLSQ